MENQSNQIAKYSLPCNSCGTKKPLEELIKCLECKCYWYCSGKCQMNDEIHHQKKCSSGKSFRLFIIDGNDVDDVSCGSIKVDMAPILNSKSFFRNKVPVSEINSKSMILGKLLYSLRLHFINPGFGSAWEGTTYREMPVIPFTMLLMIDNESKLYSFSSPIKVQNNQSVKMKCGNVIFHFYRKDNPKESPENNTNSEGSFGDRVPESGVSSESSFGNRVPESKIMLLAIHYLCAEVVK